MTTALKEKYQTTLRRGLCEVVFTKANGEERQMTCTLHSDYLPPISEEEDNPSKPKRTSNETDDVVTVWDVDAEGWRRFRLDSIVQPPTLIE